MKQINKYIYIYIYIYYIYIYDFQQFQTIRSFGDVFPMVKLE